MATAPSPPTDRWVPRMALAVALAATIGTFAVGMHWNTAAIGGSDSHCYAGQARMMAGGALSLQPPLAVPVPWPNAAGTFAPSGFSAGPDPSGASVPTCPAGLALMMALALKLGGIGALFAVVPVLGALAVWCTFVIGRRLAGPAAGAASAILVACSPSFLFQLVQPMSDVPAAGLWTASLALALTARDHPRTVRYALGAGLAAAAAILVRPNLAPLSLFPLLLVLPSRAAALGVIAGVLPGVIAVAWLQTAMYGSPLQSGYGALGNLFQFGHFMPNLKRYPAWLAVAHTPVLAIALLAPLVAAARRQIWILLGFSVAVLLSYLWYVVFDDWWYTRMLLPGIPVLIVLMVIVVSTAVRRLPSPVHAAVVLLLAAALGGFWVTRAQGLEVFRLKALERKYIELGQYAARALPPNALVLAAQPAGGVRFYANKPTLSWDAIDAAWLDRVLEEVRRRGYAPYLAIESWEIPRFTAQFRGQTTLGALDWPARAAIGRVIFVYDPADRARYLAGENVRTENITWSLK